MWTGRRIFGVFLVVTAFGLFQWAGDNEYRDIIFGVMILAGMILASVDPIGSVVKAIGVVIMGVALVGIVATNVQVVQYWAGGVGLGGFILTKLPKR